MAVSIESFSIESFFLIKDVIQYFSTCHLFAPFAEYTITSHFFLTSLQPPWTPLPRQHVASLTARLHLFSDSILCLPSLVIRFPKISCLVPLCPILLKTQPHWQHAFSSLSLLWNSCPFAPIFLYNSWPDHHALINGFLLVVSRFMNIYIYIVLQQFSEWQKLIERQQVSLPLPPPPPREFSDLYSVNIFAAPQKLSGIGKELLLI